MTLSLAGDLEGQFVTITGPKSYQPVDRIEDADGVTFLCPKCFQKNGGSVGTHHMICWQPHVDPERTPKPGRWRFEGTGLDDLTLVNGSSSILIQGGCKAHFWIREGKIEGLT